MPNKLYLECYSGISGDMTVAALLDLGADQQVLMEGLESLNLPGYQLKIGRVKKNGIDACDFDVILDEPEHHHDHDHEHHHDHDHDDHDHDEHEHHHHCLLYTSRLGGSLYARRQFIIVPQYKKIRMDVITFAQKAQPILVEAFRKPH